MRGAASVLVVVAALALVACTSTRDISSEDQHPVAEDCAGPHEGPGAIVGFDRSTGDVHWTRLIGERRGTSMVAEGSLLKISEGGGVEAYDAATGQARWCRDADPTPEVVGLPSIAAADEDTLVLHTLAGQVVALDLATGAERWSVPLQMGMNPRLDLLSGTVIVREEIVVAVPRGVEGGRTTRILGTFDLETGAAIDHPDDVSNYDALSDAGGEHPGGIEFVSEVIYPSEVSLTVRDHQTGEPIWTRTVRGVGASLRDDIVYLMEQNGPEAPVSPTDVDTTLIALRALDGSELWRVTIPDAQPFPDLEVDPVLWSVGSRITAYDRASGAELWSADPGSPGRGGRYSEPGRFGGFAVSDDGSVVAGFIYAEEPHRD